MTSGKTFDDFIFERYVVISIFLKKIILFIIALKKNEIKLNSKI